MNTNEVKTAVFRVVLLILVDVNFGVKKVSKQLKQAVVRGTTNPAPVLPRSQKPKTAISLHSQLLGGGTGLPEDHIQWNWTFRLHSFGGSTF